MRALFSILLLTVSTASFAQPVHDEYAGRKTIAALPYSDTVGDISTATSNALDPRVFCRIGAPGAGGRSVWYSYTSGAQTEYLNVLASGFDTMIAVYTGDLTRGLEPVLGGCNDDGGLSLASRIQGLRIEPATTITIYVAAFSSGTTTPSLSVQVDSARRYQVTTTADVAGGPCTLVQCSLREAVSANNTDPGVILLGAGTYTLTLVGSDDLNANGDLDLLVGTAIYGVGAAQTVIDGNLTDRVLHLDPAASGRGHTLILGDLTIRRGNTGGNGGGLLNPAPTNVNEHIALERIAMIDNRAGVQGGGLWAASYLDIRDSAFEDNVSGSSGGALAFQHPVTADVNSRARIERTSFTSNRANPTSAAGGGGLYLRNGEVDIRSSTISGNRSGFNGGGILATGAVLLSLRSSTIAENEAASSGGGLRFETSGDSTLQQNVFTRNQAGAPLVAQECSYAGSANLLSDYNLLESGNGNCPFDGVNDLPNVSSGLGPQVNVSEALGRVHLPSRSSFARDGGPTTCSTAADQRRVTRPQDGNLSGVAECDLGAIEVELLFGNGFGPGGGG